MNDIPFLIDSFPLKRHGVRIYRIVYRNSGTLLWISREHALRYLESAQSKKLQAIPAGNTASARCDVDH
jgi:hypothetical protein